MKVSAKGEYACVAMVELAARYRANQPVRLKDIADAHGISPRFLVQILLQLKGAGLVASLRGWTGGYQLARPPSAISLADIITIIDRRPIPASVLSGLPQSGVVQAVRAVWQEVETEERRILKRTTLAELLCRAQEGHASTYQI